MMKSRMATWTAMGLICLGLMLLSLVTYAQAACQTGCLEGNCFKNGGQCFKTDRTTCIPAVAAYWGDPARGAIGGTATDVDPPVVVKVHDVPNCSKECAKTQSRALNSSGMTTCSGDETNPENRDLCFCAGE